MIGTVWNNGTYNPSGVGYGIKIKQTDRDKYFNRDWVNVILELEDEKISISVSINKSSFWSNCRQLIKKEIGIWLIGHERGTWEKGSPHKAKIEQISDNRFSVNFI